MNKEQLEARILFKIDPPAEDSPIAIVDARLRVEIFGQAAISVGFDEIALEHTKDKLRASMIAKFEQEFGCVIKD